jgi:hypothetical protein
MHMIRPQGIGVNGQVVLARGHPQAVKVMQPIVGTEEDWLTIVAALQHKRRQRRGGKTRKSGHGERGVSASSDRRVNGIEQMPCPMIAQPPAHPSPISPTSLLLLNVGFMSA